jgi:hypothetical protein
LQVGTGWSKTWTFFESAWHEGKIGITGPRTHAAWLCSVVFEGARAFEGVTPDLELHCARVNDSAKKLFLKPTLATEGWVRLGREGIQRFDKDAALYIRPMYWGEKDGPWGQAHDPESTRWCLSIYEAPMRTPKGFSVTLSPYRRHCLRYVGQRRRTCYLQYFHGERRCGIHPHSERHVSSRDYASKSNRVVAPKWSECSREDAVLPRFRKGRRDLRDRKLFQGRSGDSHQRSHASLRSDLQQGSRTLLGVRTFMIVDPPAKQLLMVGVSASNWSTIDAIDSRRRVQCEA